MNGKIQYAVIQLGDERRGERLNAAIVLFHPNSIEIKIPKRLDKLRALSNAVSVEDVRASLSSLTKIDEFIRKGGDVDPEARLIELSKNSSFHFSALSDFYAASRQSYEDWSERLLALFVEPEPDYVRKMPRRSSLSKSIKQAFRDERILAKRDEDLSNHRIVPNVSIADGLIADFVLQNGAMHVIEAVDASSDTASLRKTVADIAVSALVLEQARMTYGENRTTSRLIYEASSSNERLAWPSLEAAAHQGAELINWSSHDDRRKLLVSMAMLAEPLPVKRRGSGLSINSSLQGRLKLN